MNKKTLVAATLGMTTFAGIAVASDTSKASIDFRLRYETVSQDNALKDADALTLRTKLNFATASHKGLSAFVEFEDSRVVGIDDYNDTNGKNAGVYSVIADPETTELDQGYLKYVNDAFTAKVGRQVIALDGHRHVGHVGWRQDKQTFDAATFTYAKDKLSASYSYLSKRNRIFGEEKDLDAKDHLLNVSYKTGLGKVTGYSYMLEVDNDTDNALDTYGISLTGKKDKFSYHAEFATQESESGGTDYEATYMALEGGYAFDKVTAKVGVEVLGSDDGMYGFSTPLATLHKFNGWSDQFLGTPSQGLVDVYGKLAGKALSGKWLVAFHSFSADEDTNGVDDLGTEINAQYARGFGKNYSAGIKFAVYSAGDDEAGKVDTDKVWLWFGAKF